MQLRRNYLDSLLVSGSENGPQRFVSVDDLLNDLLQHAGIERADHAEGNRHIVLRVSRLKLINEPQSLLGKRQGE
jgi:hypothetical protein